MISFKCILEENGEAI